MGLFTTELEETKEMSAELEPELQEGDGRVPSWLWLIVGAVILSAAVFAPFQLFWPFG